MRSIVKKFLDENKWLLIVVTIIIIVGLAQRHFYSNKPQIYTIGKLLKVEFPVRGSATLIFTYSYKTKIYKNLQGQEKLPYQIGKRYFVSIPEGYPSHGWLMLDKPVPDSIKEAPPEGWKKLPVKFE